MPTSKPLIPAPPAAIPYRNSTISEPSRNTASATTANSMVRELEPALTALPTDCMCCTSSRECEDIQITCQAIISTAANSTDALNNSCPEPLSDSAIAPAHSATTIAPSTPSVMPPPM